MVETILLVPGFAASHLRRRDYGGDRTEKIWLSQIDIAWSGIADLDTDPAISPTTLDRVTPVGVLEEVYQPFIHTMWAWGIEVAAWAYDWRADIQTNAQRLAVWLDDNADPDRRITVVGHSMGGLVATAALNRIADRTIPRIRRLLTCATPWRGSYRALQLFSGDHDIVQTVVNLNRILSRRSKREWTREAVRVVASWPGAYDLLPMPDLMSQYPAGPGQDFRTDAWISAANPWFNATRYAEAVARRPISLPIPESIPHYNLRGTGRTTVGPSPTVFEGTLSHYLFSLYGDTTVPEWSSWAPGALNAIGSDFDADHEQFMNGRSVVTAILRIMGYQV